MRQSGIQFNIEEQNYYDEPRYLISVTLTPELTNGPEHNTLPIGYRKAREEAEQLVHHLRFAAFTTPTIIK